MTAPFAHVAVPIIAGLTAVVALLALRIVHRINRHNHSLPEDPGLWVGRDYRCPDGSSSHRLSIFTSNRLNKNKKSGRCSRVVTAYNAFAVWRGKRRPSASRSERCSSSG